MWFYLRHLHCDAINVTHLISRASLHSTPVTEAKATHDIANYPKKSQSDTYSMQSGHSFHANGTLIPCKGDTQFHAPSTLNSMHRGHSIPCTVDTNFMHRGHSFHALWTLIPCTVDTHSIHRGHSFHSKWTLIPCKVDTFHARGHSFHAQCSITSYFFGQSFKFV